MDIVFLSIIIVMGFLCFSFLLDISINLRRVGGDIKKMVKSYDKVHSLGKV